MSAIQQSRLLDSSLPDEMRICVFDFLAPEDLGECLLVSKAVADLSKSTILKMLERKKSCDYDYMGQTRTVLSRFGNGPAAVDAASRCLSRLERLDLRSSSLAYGKLWDSATKYDNLGGGVNALARRLSHIFFQNGHPKLRTLLLSSPLDVNTLRDIRTVEQSVLDRCPALTALKLEDWRLDAQFFNYLGQRLPALEKFGYSSERSVGNLVEEAEDQLVEGCLPKLTQLRVLELRHRSFTNVSAFAIAKHVSSTLTSLSLTSSRVDREGLAAVIRHCVKLTHLDMSDFKWTDALLEMVGTHLKKLHFLEMWTSESADYSDTGLAHLARGCPQLEWLRIDVHYPEYTWSGIQTLISSCKNVQILVREKFLDKHLEKDSEHFREDAAELCRQQRLIIGWRSPESKIRPKFESDNLWL